MGSFTHSIKGKSMVLGWNRCYGLQPLMTALKLYVFFWCNLLELCFIKVLKVDVVVDSNCKFNLSRIQNPTCLMLIDYLPGPCNNISPFSGLSPVVTLIFTLITKFFLYGWILIYWWHASSPFILFSFVWQYWLCVVFCSEIALNVKIVFMYTVQLKLLYYMQT